MSKHTLIHDCAWKAGLDILDSVRHLIRAEEHRDAHGVFYEIAKGAIERFDIMQAREAHRLLKPSNN
jgi:hypothetical protein